MRARVDCVLATCVPCLYYLAKYVLGTCRAIIKPYVCCVFHVCLPVSTCTYRALLQAIRDAIKAGVIVVAATQCLRGSVSLGTYEVGT